MTPSNLHPPSSPLPLNQIHTYEQLLAYLHHLSIDLNLNFSPSRPNPPPHTGPNIISAARSICETATTLRDLRQGIEQEICIRTPSDEENGHGEVDLETKILLGFLEDLTDLEEGGVEGWVRWLETLKCDELLEQAGNSPRDAALGEQRMGSGPRRADVLPQTGNAHAYFTAAATTDDGKIPHSPSRTQRGEESTRRRRPTGKDIAYLTVDYRSKGSYDADDDASPPSVHAQPERRVPPRDAEAEMRRRVASGYRYIPALVAGLPAVQVAGFGPRVDNPPARKEEDVPRTSRGTRAADTEERPQASAQRSDPQRRRCPAPRAEKKRDFYRRLAEEDGERGSDTSFIEIQRITRWPPPPSSPNDADDEASGSLHIRQKPKMRGGMGSPNFYYNSIHDLWSREEQYSEPDQDNDKVEKKIFRRKAVETAKEEQKLDDDGCDLPRVPSLDWKEWKGPPIPTPRDSPPHSYAHSSPSSSPPKATIEPGTIMSTPTPLSVATAFYFFPSVSTIALLGPDCPHPFHFFQWSTHPQSPGPITLDQIREFLKDRKERGVETHEGFVKIREILGERDRRGLKDPVAPKGKMVCVEMPKVAQREGEGNEGGKTSSMETDGSVPIQRGRGGCCSVRIPDLDLPSLGLDFMSPELYSSEEGATEGEEHWKGIGYLVKALMGQVSSDDEYEEDYQTRGRSVTNRYENTGNRGGGKTGLSPKEVENLLDEEDMAYFNASLHPEYDSEMGIHDAEPEFEGACDSWAGFTSPGHNRCSYCHVPFDELEPLISGSPATSITSATHEDDAPSPVMGSHWDECRHSSTEAHDGSQERFADVHDNTGMGGMNRHEYFPAMEGPSLYSAGIREYRSTFSPSLPELPSWPPEHPGLQNHERTMSQDSTMSDYGIGPRETHFYATASGIVKDDRHGEENRLNRGDEVEEKILSLCAVVQSMVRQVEATLEQNRRARETPASPPAVSARVEDVTQGTDGGISSAGKSTGEEKDSYEALLSSLQNFDPYEHTRHHETSHQSLSRDPAQAFHLPCSPPSPLYQSPIYLPPSPVSPPSSPFISIVNASDTSDRYSEENATLEGCHQHSSNIKVELNGEDAPSICMHCSFQDEKYAETRRDIEEMLKLTIRMFGDTDRTSELSGSGKRQGVESAPNTPATSKSSESEDQPKATINSVDKGKQPVRESLAPQLYRPYQGPIQPAHHVQSQPLSWDPAWYIPYAGPSRPRVHRMPSTASYREEAISPLQTRGWEDEYRREIGKGGSGKKRSGVWID